jgi:lysine biosynthesis protein LysW
MVIAQCVECDENIELGSQVRVGAKLTCHNCGAHLEVVSLDPAEVDWAYDDDEDDDDWDFEEDDLSDDKLDLEDLEELDDFDDDDDDDDDDLDDGR